MGRAVYMQFVTDMSTPVQIKHAIASMKLQMAPASTSCLVISLNQGCHFKATENHTGQFHTGWPWFNEGRIPGAHRGTSWVLYTVINISRSCLFHAQPPDLQNVTHVVVLPVLLEPAPTVFSWTQSCQTRLTVKSYQEEFRKQTWYFTFYSPGQASWGLELVFFAFQTASVGLFFFSKLDNSAVHS